ncbi:cytoplasmic dynein 2 light intermediate chain 1 [Fasciolopsis buskii]|uniref:Cytoplasmic dynein 2 light intermediate chain 1 n=1 Tax=Fasciolopsis buskii TaxID=27845 RepID=A0A8E0RQJ7_9TREM|nr:cytoplasmic dynein 2 light intermediate chain 1 [Fasciolopsis buski]
MTQSVWDIAIQQNRARIGMIIHKKRKPSIDSCDEKVDSTIVFFGSSSSGKTTIINRILEREEKPKSTLALDYTFGRKAMGALPTKSVTHIWELGGGVRLSDLLCVPISLNALRNLFLVLVLDLSKPEELWITTETLLEAVKSRYDQIICRLKKNDHSQIHKKYHCILEGRTVPSHPDQELLNAFPIPLTIIGMKYDLLLSRSSEHQQIVSKTLRFLNHYYSSSLYFASVKDETSMKRIKGVLSNLAFRSSFTPTVQLDIGKPLSVPEGTDSFANIGVPPNADISIDRLNAKTPLEMWKAAFCGNFNKATNTLAVLRHETDPAKEPQFAEPLVDQARKSKDEEFDQIQRQNERRMREILQQTAADGIFIA